jgi:hypothetical protein
MSRVSDEDHAGKEARTRAAAFLAARAMAATDELREWGSLD